VGPPGRDNDGRKSEVTMLSCPQCGKEARTVQGLAKHLSGTRAYGGHDLAVDEASLLAERIASGATASFRAKGRAEVTAARAPAVVVRGPAPASIPELDGATERSFLTALMTSMAAHKALPKYQFERRVDAFLAVLLPDLLGQLLGTQVDFVVPEFPLKHAASNQSTNVDHVYFDRRGRWLFVEIKTEVASVNQTQIDQYLRAASRGMAPLLADVAAIRRASKEQRKYAVLLDMLAAFPASGPIDVVYLAPATATLPRTAGMRVVSYRELAALEHRVFAQAWDLFRTVLVPVID